QPHHDPAIAGEIDRPEGVGPFDIFPGREPDFAAVGAPASRLGVLGPAPRENPLPLPVLADDPDRGRTTFVDVLPERDQAPIARKTRTMRMTCRGENVSDRELQPRLPGDQVRDGQLLSVRSEIGAELVDALEDLSGSAPRHLD